MRILIAAFFNIGSEIKVYLKGNDVPAVNLNIIVIAVFMLLLIYTVKPKMINNNKSSASSYSQIAVCLFFDL